MRLRVLVLSVSVLLLAAAAVLFVTRVGAPPTPSPRGGRLLVVGAENEYKDVLSQIGGRYVQAVAIIANPNTDPHAFESSTLDAREVSRAAVVVQNGLGYDSFMNELEAASPSAGRTVLAVSRIIGAGPSTENPHLWYKPGAMRSVAQRIEAALSHLQPQHRAYFTDRLAAFEQSLVPWQQALRALRATYGGTRVAVTEPVADYLLEAAGLQIATPWTYQAAVMNGQDPSPQDVATQQALIAQRRVAVLVYNLQAVDPSTEALLSLAKAHGVPVVGVYETMPTGFDYQGWMLAETNALEAAISQHRSEVKLP